MSKCKVILMCSQKGGSCKTTNVLNLATASIFKGNKNVGILDCDPQRTASNWQNENRDRRVSDYEYVLPQVVTPNADVMPSQLITKLRDQVDLIWIDTAGFLGLDSDTSRLYLADILPHVDLILTPLTASRFDVDSTKDTMELIKMIGEDIDLKNIPKLLLGSNINNGQRGYSYLCSLLDPILQQYPEWVLLESYIPYSGALVRSHERGGNAFVPKKIKNITEAYLATYYEMEVALGVQSKGAEREQLQNVVSSVQSVRNSAMKEKRLSEAE